MTAYTWDMVVDRLFGNLPVQVRFGRPGAPPAIVASTTDGAVVCAIHAMGIDATHVVRRRSGVFDVLRPGTRRTVIMTITFRGRRRVAWNPEKQEWEEIMKHEKR